MTTTLRKLATRSDIDKFFAHYGTLRSLAYAQSHDYLKRDTAILLYFEESNKRAIYLVETLDQIKTVYENFPKNFKQFYEVPVSVLDERVGLYTGFATAWQLGELN